MYHSYDIAIEPFTNTGTASVAYKYTGKELDDSTGLYFYEARYYDATLGRFISADTLVPNPGNHQDFNRYTYGNNNPILFNDPTGRFGIKSITNAFKKATRKLKNTLGSPGFTVLSFGIQVGIVPVPFLSPIQSGILGTGLLTQSKSGRYVLAGEIIIGTAAASIACAPCAQAAVINGAAFGTAITGGFGAYSAAQNGGDISKGLLFGAAMGGAAGALNGGTTAEFNFSYDWFPGVKIGKVFALRIGAGAIAGAAGGSTVGYAGGAGSVNDIMHGAFHGAIVGAAVAGAFTTIDYLGGIELGIGEVKGLPGQSPESQAINLDALTGTVSPSTVQSLSRTPWVSSLAVSGASSFDVLSNGRLTGLALQKIGNKGGNCSIEFEGESGCGLGQP
ncbi:MAG: RHS repeat-associated core domain-containing protein [Nitrospiraceae bacterium]|nr:RHS repeat-associated core domain-containing protein [Nitrospiraceae bacterium]